MFLINIYCKRPDGSVGGEGRGTTEGIAMAIALGVQSALYYVGLGYETRVKIEETCAECAGEGKVRDTRSRVMFKQKTCPSCKGKAPSTAPIEFPILKNETVRVVAVNSEGQPVL